MECKISDTYIIHMHSVSEMNSTEKVISNVIAISKNISILEIRFIHSKYIAW